MTITETPRRATRISTPMRPTPGGAKDPRPANPSSAPNRSPLDGAQLGGHHAVVGTQDALVAADQPADRQTHDEPHSLVAVGSETGAGSKAKAVSQPTVAALFDPALALAADVLDDLEQVKLANENRLRQLTRSTEDADGEVRGFGLDRQHPDVARLAAIVDMLGKIEHDADLNLQRIMRRHPLHPWAKSTRGIGDRQLARLLAVIGDPYVRAAYELEDGTVVLAAPRTVSALWAYCGLHVLPVLHVGGTGGDPGQYDSETHRSRAGVAPRKQRGQLANWSTRAKTRTYLIAESCVKQYDKGACPKNDETDIAVHADSCACSRYRIIYDAGRTKYADATHPVECARCGPRGKPAPAGSPLSAGHKHARAMRLAMKEILLDLWREAKALHESNARTTMPGGPRQVPNF